jgi:hypothetical protein
MTQTRNPRCRCLLIGNLHVHFHPAYWGRLRSWSRDNEWSWSGGPLTLYYTGEGAYDIGCGKVGSGPRREW